MSQCPFANFKNLIDPETYVDGMPYEELARIRKSGPIHYMEDLTMGVPYWLITGRDEIDYISKNPKLFSSEARSALAEEYSEDEMETIHRHMTINMDPPRHMKNRRIVRASFTPIDFLFYVTQRERTFSDLYIFALGGRDLLLKIFLLSFKHSDMLLHLRFVEF